MPPKTALIPELLPILPTAGLEVALKGKGGEVNWRKERNLRSRGIYGALLR